MNNIELFVHVVAVVVIAYTLSILISQYRNYLEMKCKFRYFALRDDLAMLVMYGDMNEDSSEYQGLVDVINYHICAMDQITFAAKISAFMKASQMTLDTADEIKVGDERVRAIMFRLLENTASVIHMNSWFELWLVKLLVSLRIPKDNRMARGITAPAETEKRLKEKMHDFEPAHALA